MGHRPMCDEHDPLFSGFYEVSSGFLRNRVLSGGSLLVGTTPKCRIYLRFRREIRKRKRLSERKKPKLKLGGRNHPLFTFYGLLLKKE
ncbi:hypothetical protein Hanom_Chr16g01432571 [Helianthus anomalus]